MIATADWLLALTIMYLFPYWSVTHKHCCQLVIVTRHCSFRPQPDNKDNNGIREE